jgi:hypothetical protein
MLWLRESFNAVHSKTTEKYSCPIVEYQQTGFTLRTCCDLEPVAVNRTEGADGKKILSLTWRGVTLEHKGYPILSHRGPPPHHGFHHPPPRGPPHHHHHRPGHVL